MPRRLSPHKTLTAHRLPFYNLQGWHLQRSGFGVKCRHLRHHQGQGRLPPESPVLAGQALRAPTPHGHPGRQRTYVLEEREGFISGLEGPSPVWCCSAWDLRAGRLVIIRGRTKSVGPYVAHHLGASLTPSLLTPSHAQPSSRRGGLMCASTWTSGRCPRPWRLREAVKRSGSGVGPSRCHRLVQASRHLSAA